MVMMNLRSDFNPFQLFFHVGHDAVIFTTTKKSFHSAHLIAVI
jgi:hypothetical protein